jgi:hypothetical protein
MIPKPKNVPGPNSSGSGAVSPARCWLTAPARLHRQRLVDVGLTEADCASAAVLEVQLRVDPCLRPGLPQAARRQAVKRSQEAYRSVRREALFRALEACLREQTSWTDASRCTQPDPVTGAVAIDVTGLQQIDPALARLPILHLDATLRPGLAESVLPGLEVTEIAADMPHMQLTAVQGSFGKSSLGGRSERSLRTRTRAVVTDCRSASITSAGRPLGSHRAVFWW